MAQRGDTLNPPSIKSSPPTTHNKQSVPPPIPPQSPTRWGGIGEGRGNWLVDGFLNTKLKTQKPENHLPPPARSTGVFP